MDVAASPQTSKITRQDEVEDSSVYTDTDLGVIDEHKNIILHLLSQLKLGMDLTKVWNCVIFIEEKNNKDLNEK